MAVRTIFFLAVRALWKDISSQNIRQGWEKCEDGVTTDRGEGEGIPWPSDLLSKNVIRTVRSANVFTIVVTIVIIYIHIYIYKTNHSVIFKQCEIRLLDTTKIIKTIGHHSSRILGKTTVLKRGYVHVHMHTLLPP